MGHNRGSRLAATARWTNVGALIAASRSVADIAAATVNAAESELATAADNAVFAEWVRLLATIPDAALSQKFSEGLRDLGLRVPDRPLAVDLIAAVGHRLDIVDAGSHTRSDMGELARRAMMGTLAAEFGTQPPGDFGVEPASARSAFGTLATPRGFAAIAETFFGRLAKETLSYWLDRTLSSHVGEGRRFGGFSERSAFDAELARHAGESAGVIRQMSAGWYEQASAAVVPISQQSAQLYATLALRRIYRELAMLRAGDD